MPIIESLSDNKVKELLGSELFKEWRVLVNLIESKYEMEEVWHTADKGNAFELKFRRGGKTLVSLFPNFPEANKIGVMVIFGKLEREKLEEQSDKFSNYTLATYHEAKTFHDGKWVMFLAPSKDLTADLINMLVIKRKPNRKQEKGRII